MNALKNLLTRTVDETDYSIAVMQYKRAAYTLGDEEHFHWALMVLTDIDQQDGHLWRAVNRVHLTDEGQGVVVWEIDSIPDIKLTKTFRCLGGVIIGRMKPDDLDTLSKVRWSRFFWWMIVTWN